MIPPDLTPSWPLAPSIVSSTVETKNSKINESLCDPVPPEKYRLYFPALSS